MPKAKPKSVYLGMTHAEKMAYKRPLKRSRSSTFWYFLLAAANKAGAAAKRNGVGRPPAEKPWLEIAK